MINGNEDIAENVMSQILKFDKGDSFFIEDLDKAYSSRCIAPFFNLRNENNREEYVKMMDKELTFNRVRTKKVDDKENILM